MSCYGSPSKIIFKQADVIHMYLYITSKGGSRTAVTAKVELFVIIVNGWKPLTIITKSSTLDVAAVLDPPLTSNEIIVFIKTTTE